MELTKSKEEAKKFLGRKELVLKGKADVTPSKAELKETIAKMTSSPAEMVIVKKVNQQFGRKDFEVEAYIYESEKFLKEFEKEKKKKAEAPK